VKERQSYKFAELRDLFHSNLSCILVQQIAFQLSIYVYIYIYIFFIIFTLLIIPVRFPLTKSALIGLPVTM